MESMDRLTGALADRYRIEREIGSGGMATVYLAEDLKHRRPVAIKVLRPELSAALGTDRFLREIEVVAGLNHPNILGLHDSGEADGLRYFVMPFVEGESLRARLDREPSLPLEEAARITREIGEALHYAHGHGLVHRDIKPENILFQAGHALLCDFGITQVAGEAHERLTRTGMAVGTFTYMSPEQLTDDQGVDCRTDVYALGCLLHEMLSGEVAFPASTPQVALAKKLTGTATDLIARRPDLPRTLEGVLDRAMAVQADDRFPTAEAFTSALDVAITATAVEKGTRRRRRSRMLRAVAAVTGILLIGAGAWWVSGLIGSPAMERIAVLPFSNRENNPAQDYFVQGVHQDLVLELAKAGVGAGLGVINAASVARYAGTALGLRDIAAELGVDGVVQGYASVGTDRVTVDLQLIDVLSEEILWTESFQSTTQSVGTLYRLAAGAIADFLGLRLDEEARARLAQSPEVDPAVYDALLQARFHWQKLTSEGIDTALDYYELALERSDSLSVEAWVGVALTWGARAQQGLISGVEASQMSEPAMARALELDPSLSGLQYELALFRGWTDWDWAGAEEAFRRALEEDPTDSMTRVYFGHLLLYLDRDAEALQEMDEAVRIDSFNTLVQAIYAMGLNALHRSGDAEMALQRVLERDPQAPIVLSTLRTTYHLLGRHEEAMEMWRTSYQANPEALEALERGYQAGGYLSALKAVADLRVERSATTHVVPWQIATLYTRAGLGEEALAYLELAFEEHDPNIPYISSDAIFDYMRAEPRFQALMDRLGLPQSPGVESP